MGSTHRYSAPKLAPKQLALLKQALRGTGVFAYPTESVYGLGCDPDDSSAVYRILSMKNRPLEKGLILLASNIEQFAPMTDKLSTQDQEKLLATWPGPITWIIPHFGLVPSYISGGRDTVAVRVSTHPVAAGIAAYLEKPIVSTSANPTGLRPAYTRLKCRNYFGGQLPIIPGALGELMRPTPIKHLITEEVYRS